MILISLQPFIIIKINFFNNKIYHLTTINHDQKKHCDK